MIGDGAGIYWKDPGTSGQSSQSRMHLGLRSLRSLGHSIAGLTYALYFFHYGLVQGNKAVDSTRDSYVTALLPKGSSRSKIPGKTLVDLAQPIRVRNRWNYTK